MASHHRLLLHALALPVKTFVCLGLVLFFLTGARADDKLPGAIAAPQDYRLVWADEFKQDPDGLPDPKKWIYEEGFVRNHESQYYTRERTENARVENGKLIIEARKESFPNPFPHGPREANYTSAALETRGKVSWTYGRIEVRAKLPAGKGVWPAIWTLGDSEGDKSIGWPKCGENDIMELVGKEPGWIYGTVHYFVNGKHASEGSKTKIDHPENDFHIYATEWTPDRIDIFVDGQKYLSFDVSKADNDGQNPFRKPHFIILNLAIGGDWGGPIDDSIFPQRMTIDYVRVYQKTPVAGN
jgi:beta-glucanase (GH16 family)